MRIAGLYRPLVGGPAAIASCVLAAQPAHATEGGASFYLLGSGGPGAGELPAVTGIFFDNTYYYYHGEATAGRQFVVGGNLVAGLDATINADFATVMWFQPPTSPVEPLPSLAHSRSVSPRSMSTQ